MATTGKLIPVTPEELEAILDRLQAESVTKLAITGPDTWLGDNPESWPEAARGGHAYQLQGPMESLARCVARLPQLQHLLLFGVKLDAMGAETIAMHLPHLNSLKISGSNIGEAGARVIGEHLPQLNSLDIDGNDIGDAGARAIGEYLPQLNSLNISGNNIGEEGACAIAEHLTKLNSLSVGLNNIGDAGACAIAQHLTNLNSLYIGGNNIGGAGARAIAEHLTQLNSLSIWRNNIGESGACAIAEHLTQLDWLYLDNNNIGEVGAQAIATNLRQLRSLWLEENSIGQSTISAIGRNLHELSALSVANNKEVCDTTALAQLPALSHLNISQTSVSDLSPFAERVLSGWPVHWNRWGSGPGLFVEGCPLVSPSVEVASQGPDAVLNYFREIEAQGVDRLDEAKVLILGEGGAGKTSLLRRLYQADRPLPTEDETTRGIDIHLQDFVADNGKPFRLNVWDFGGQQIYHATHQFFLTKSSLYILVDDTRKDDKSIHDEAFKFWLEVVAALSDSSPLLIFQNEKGDRSKTIDEPGIKGRFPNFKEAYRGNLEKVGSADQLRKAIEHFVQRLPHVGEPVPAKWPLIRQAIEEVAKQKPYISQDDYFAVYGKHLKFDRTKALHLSRYLHDLGVFLHFQDDPLLRKSVILQNQWATEAVFRILDDESIKGQRGRFAQADCERLWTESQYADMHGELLGLMVKFELCYPLANAHEHHWLAPQLLSPSKPQALAKWASPADLVVSFRYTFLPRGLVSRLMVRQHRFVKRLDWSWAHGAFFEHDSTAVLVEETAKGNEIQFRARGPENKALLSVLSSDLEALNESFKGLKGKVEKLVPCVCSKCRHETAPEMYLQSELVRRKSLGKQTIECRQSFDDVSVLELLDGLKLEHLPDWAKPAKPVSEPINADDRMPRPKQKVKEKTIKIFLASSAELRADRDEFELYFRQQNDRLREEGLYLKIVRWENFLDAMSSTRLQDEYNKAVCACDIFVSLFKTKTGKYTAEEFNVAWQNFKSTGQPRIYTYFREFELSSKDFKMDDLKSLEDFKLKLRELGHYPTDYKDAEHLKRHFTDQLHKLNLAESPH